jgi:broad specificity phosphatase PhoE
LLSENGIQQAQETKKLLNQIKLHNFIFVSPHRRTILTAVHSLATHPQKGEFVLKLFPWAKEVMISACELPVPLSALRIFN